MTKRRHPATPAPNLAAVGAWRGVRTARDATTSAARCPSLGAVAPGAPWFVTDAGDAWTPVGQNDAITWLELAGLCRRRELGAVEAHLRYLRASGVICLRLMLEYCQGEHRYLERPVGRAVPAMVRL